MALKFVHSWRITPNLFMNKMFLNNIIKADDESSKLDKKNFRMY